jgi:hypothetical protein
MCQPGDVVINSLEDQLSHGYDPMGQRRHMSAILSSAGHMSLSLSYTTSLSFGTKISSTDPPLTTVWTTYTPEPLPSLSTHQSSVRPGDQVAPRP